MLLENGLFHSQEFNCELKRLGYSRKISNVREGFGTYVLKKSLGNSGFLTLPLKISDKTKLHHWKFFKIVLDCLEILRPKTETSGNSAWFFLNHTWKFHFFNEPLYILHTISPISLEIPHPQSSFPLFVFSTG